MTGDFPTKLDHLVERAAAGERAALDSLLLHFHDPLRRFIVATIALSGTAGISHDDLLNEAIIAAILGVRKITPRGADAFFAWLQTVARNCHLNMISAANAQKRGGGRVAVTGNGNGDPFATSILKQIAGHAPSPSLMLRRKEAIEAIARAIAKLAPEQRLIINRYYTSRMTVQELAKETGKSEAAIRTSLHRILENLRDTLATDFGDFSAGL